MRMKTITIMIIITMLKNNYEDDKNDSKLSLNNRKQHHWQYYL